MDTFSSFCIYISFHFPVWMLLAQQRETGVYRIWQSKSIKRNNQHQDQIESDENIQSYCYLINEFSQFSFPIKKLILNFWENSFFIWIIFPFLFDVSFVHYNKRIKTNNNIFKPNPISFWYIIPQLICNKWFQYHLRNYIHKHHAVAEPPNTPHTRNLKCIIIMYWKRKHVNLLNIYKDVYQWSKQQGDKIIRI